MLAEHLILLILQAIFQNINVTSGNLVPAMTGIDDCLLQDGIIQNKIFLGTYNLLRE